MGRNAGTRYRSYNSGAVPASCHPDDCSPMFVPFATPNAGAHLPPEAEARHERRLEAVRCSAVFGAGCVRDVRPPSDPSPCCPHHATRWVVQWNTPTVYAPDIAAAVTPGKRVPVAGEG